MQAHAHYYHHGYAVTVVSGRGQPTPCRLAHHWPCCPSWTARMMRYWNLMDPMEQGELPDRFENLVEELADPAAHCHSF